MVDSVLKWGIGYAKQRIVANAAGNAQYIGHLLDVDIKTNINGGMVAAPSLD